MFCTVNYHEDPVLAHDLEELICIINVRKLNPEDIFNHFDANKTGALDHE